MSTKHAKRLAGTKVTVSAKKKGTSRLTGASRPLAPAGYEQLLTQLETRIRGAQLNAARAVNAELVLVYWSIGRDILDRQEREGWGAHVIDRLSADLLQAFPEMKGFSPRNLKYMRAFAHAWPAESIVQQVAAQLPWFHSCVLGGPSDSTARSFRTFR